ncbi:MAG: RNA polymerase sigma-70 factor [Bacteroidales bacterium]|nr:RNA polymerase sigma-70 factor [Bacteroidales bacterium]
MSESESENKIKALFDEFYERMCLYAEGIVKNHQVAEEIVQDLFVYIWMHSDTFIINYSYKSYLFRSVHNNCLKHISRVKNEKTHETDTGDIDAFHDEEILNPLSADVPLSQIITKELEEKAEEIFNNLPEQCKKIYALNRYENMSYSEIAKKLNINVGTVKTQMFRAFKKLQEGLKDYI